MEHIVQFAIGIDDEAIRKRIEESLEKSVKENVTKDFKEALRRNRGKIRFDDAAIEIVDDMVEELLDKHKEAVIAEAAKLLANRLIRTKSAKEMLKDVVGSVESAE